MVRVQNRSWWQHRLGLASSSESSQILGQVMTGVETQLCFGSFVIFWMLQDSDKRSDAMLCFHTCDHLAN